MRNSLYILLCCLGCGSAAAEEPVFIVDTPSGVPARCREVVAPCIQMWAQMSAGERAALWPYLDEISRVMHWRSMTQKERSDMRAELSAVDRERLRRRFCTERAQAEVARETRRLGNDERLLLRRQITEFHVEVLKSQEDHVFQATRKTQVP